MEIANLTGQFLIAMPAMGDPNFEHTVTLICRHSQDGALGLVINRPAEMTMADLFEQMKLDTDTDYFRTIPLHQGGPVQPERGFVIHEPADTWESSMTVTDNISVTTSRDILQAISLREGPHNFMVTLGYAGWGEGQLEEEIMNNAWLTVPADDAIIFSTEVSNRWKQATRSMGIDVNHLSNDAGHG